MPRSFLIGRLILLSIADGIGATANPTCCIISEEEKHYRECRYHHCDKDCILQKALSLSSIRKHYAFLTTID